MHERLAYLRHHLGLSQSQIAQQLRCTTPYISMLETGKAHMSDEFLNRFCRIYHVNPDWLQYGLGPVFTEGYAVARFNLNDLPSRIKALRNHFTLTQLEMANKLGCSKDQVYSVEAGRIRPSHNWLAKVAEVFSVSLSWLTTGAGEMFDTLDTAEPVPDHLIQFLEENPNLHARMIQMMKENPELWEEYMNAEPSKADSD